MTDINMEAWERARKICREKVLAGELEDKLCFTYCGEEHCNCVGGAIQTIYHRELEKKND